ncbi:hypothetical protein NEMBOFW57_004646 [Staphylotrichum longicolle]|uniref:CBM1 domain-containing protein n=1 Tax=Staphylotrichum longicolle TaxID=669026 RepID=A0AAD4I5U5_9PEZI|nr:hypothetical protein NEMBOFW57_004646 [Staphylotrichum longicolle]
MKFSVLSGLAANALSVSAGTILWDGRFNDFTSSSDLNKWSWVTRILHPRLVRGDGLRQPVARLQEPGRLGSKQGAKITLDNTAYWNGQNMRRTELIPQTTAAINKGKIAFFESHFTELKSGWQSAPRASRTPCFRWCIGGSTKWSTEWVAGVWHNVAYEIDFDANTVGSGTRPAATPGPGHRPAERQHKQQRADWHVGVLELPRSGYPDSDEDYYWSGVYIESGSITTSVAGPGAPPVVVSSSTTKAVPSSTLITSTAKVSTSTTTTKVSTTSTHTKVSTTSTTSTSAAPATSTKPSGCTAPQWSQCDGIGYSGCKTCAAPYTCKYSNDWYSQCL